MLDRSRNAMKRRLDDKRLAIEECFLIGDSIRAQLEYIAIIGLQLKEAPPGRLPLQETSDEISVHSDYLIKHSK